MPATLEGGAVGTASRRLDGHRPHPARAKVERAPEEPRHIQTVWGVGYRLQP
jgi:DNA-binding response OmpR family regulator